MTSSILVLLSALVALANAGSLKSTFDAASISPTQVYLDVNKGRNIFLTCSLDRKNGGDVPEDIDIYFTGPDDRRINTSREAGVRVETYPIFPRVDLFMETNEKSESGGYACVATAGGEKLEAGLYVYMTDPVEVWATPTQTLKIGQKGIIKCRGNIKNNPGITWLLHDEEDIDWLASNDQWLNHNERYTVTTEGLEINPVNQWDFGRYTCRWESFAEATYATVDIDVIVN